VPTSSHRCYDNGESAPRLATVTCDCIAIAYATAPLRSAAVRGQKTQGGVEVVARNGDATRRRGATGGTTALDVVPAGRHTVLSPTPEAREQSEQACHKPRAESAGTS